MLTERPLFARGDNLTDQAYGVRNRQAFYIRNTPSYIYGEFMLRLRP